MWALFAVVGIAIAVTYARLPAGELYHVSGSGLTGGLSRLLVYLNFPLALVAIPILGILAARLRSRAVTIAAAVGAALSAAVYWPGVVKESDLDARPVNSVAAFGVFVAVALTALAVHALGWPARPTRQPRDLLRGVVAGVALLLAVPWLGADIGVSFEGVPMLGTLYQSGELRTQPGMPVPHPAVHHGHHHGMDGVLLVLSALLLSRILPTLARGVLRAAVGAYLALMLCYGTGNLANDFWLEQVVKRGWTDRQIPNVTTPGPNVAWGVILLAAAALWAIWLWRDRRPPAAPTVPSGAGAP